MVAPDSQAKHACRQAAIPLNALFKNPEPPLFRRAPAIDPNAAAGDHDRCRPEQRL
jgi:hypothetical protein